MIICLQVNSQRSQLICGIPYGRVITVHVCKWSLWKSAYSMQVILMEGCSLYMYLSDPYKLVKIN